MNALLMLTALLAPVFGDHMVLQRDAPVPVWGTAAAGETVTVEFAGQKQTAIADAGGKWAVTLPALNASSQPRDLLLQFSIGNLKSEIHDVLVGDVWICAGQSNMEFPLARDAHAAAELPAANLPRLRLLNMDFAGQYAFGRPFSRAEIARMTPDRFYEGAWQACTPASAREFSAVGYYFGKELSETRQVPVGLINLAVGGSPAEAWMRRAILPDNLPLDPWCLTRMRKNLGTNQVSHPFEPGFLWDAGPARLFPFAIRGVLWYQGESNAESDWRVRQHATLFPLLVRDWRARWGQAFPFLYVQLPGLNRTNWPAFRDQQRRFLDTIPDTGMAITIDLGHPTDVHPRAKREVGHRLALLALGRRSGPLPTAFNVKENLAVVTFNDRLVGDGGGFELAGADGSWHPASATIEGPAVGLTSPDVPAPASMRYAWTPFPMCKLTNREGLPASPFELP